LLYTAQQLAAEALQDSNKPIPAYISLRLFSGGTTDTLLEEMAAYANGLERRILDALWREKHRTLCLIVNDADEVPDHLVQTLVMALNGLFKANTSGQHSLILACRLGSLCNTLNNINPYFYELELVPLNDSEIDNFLARHLKSKHSTNEQTGGKR